MTTQCLNLFLIFSIVYLCKLAGAQTCTEFVESTTCGGNIIGDSGIIRYNHTGYGPNSGCFWLIRSNINSKVEVRLLHDTFTSNEFIEIYRLSSNGEISGNAGSMIRHADNAARQFEGPVIIMRFKTFNYNNAPVTNSSVVPSFTLLYRGCGPEVTNPPKFSHFYREKIPGETEVVTYPGDGGIYPNNQLVTYLGLTKDRVINNKGEGDWKVKVTFQDIQTSSYCLFGDALKFYSGGFSFLPALDEQDNFIDRFCQRNSTETHILPRKSPKYGNVYPDNIGILAVFSSNGSQSGKGFIFEW